MPVQTKQELLNKLSRHDRALDRLGVQRLGIFGSAQRDEMTPQSGVDILVEFRSGQKTYDNLFELSKFLEELFDRPVELITPESLSDELQATILQDVEYVERSGVLCHAEHVR